jgi:hypothetical protein
MLKELGIALGDILALISFCKKNDNVQDERGCRKKRLFKRLFGNKENASCNKKHEQSFIKKQNRSESLPWLATLCRG